MTATEVKTKIFMLLDEVAAGDEVQITKHGRIVARLVPASAQWKPGSRRDESAVTTW